MTQAATTIGAESQPIPGATRGALSIRNVTKIYDPEGVNVMAVDDCSMEIAAGEVCMIVGPSGCGKTTLLNAIAGFHSITEGEILLDGALLCGPDKPKAEQGADRMVVFQNGALSHGRRSSTMLPTVRSFKASWISQKRWIRLGRCWLKQVSNPSLRNIRAKSLQAWRAAPRSCAP